MKKPVQAVLLVVVLIGSFLGGAWYNQRGAGKDANTQLGRKVLYYVDPMNPAHTSDQPGPAPCGMPMEPIYADDEAGGTGNAPRFMSPGTARVTPEKQQMIGVRVEKVVTSTQEHALRILGRVAADENRTYRMLAGSDGWVWRVHESTTGSVVQKDQLMATVYNYQFLAREQQYLHALDFAERGRRPEQASAPLKPGEQRDLGPINVDEDSHEVQTAASASNPSGKYYYIGNQLELARLELYNLGAGDYQLLEIARARKVSSELEIRSPVAGIVLARNVSPMQRIDKGAELFQIADLSRVWILAEVFEGEVRYIRPGTTARVALPHQGRTFEAKVTEVPPRFDQTTRTLKVRLEVDNPEMELRPEMFVDVDFLLTLSPSINVPVDAVLDSGLRKTVFVDLGGGFFEPRQVQTGWRFGERVEIVEGLEPGEQIVVSGNFLIDSESRMKLAAAGLFGTPTKDPVCGMEVYPSKAKAAGLTAESGGKTFYFCSPECMGQFGKEDAHSAGQTTAETEARQSAPGAPSEPAKQEFAFDPVCRMPVLERKAKAAGLEIEYGGKAYYFCSGQCRGHFIKAPERYSDKAAPRGEGQRIAPVQGGHQHD